MRKQLILGNWKMNHTVAQSKAFASTCGPAIQLAKEKGIDIGVAPAFLSLAVVKETAPELIVAAQDCHFEENGAYTGEVSLSMLTDIGVSWVLIGHSERRLYNSETSLTCNKKIRASLDHGFTPVYCVGESLIDFENDRTRSIVSDQLSIGLMNLSKEDILKVIIAYEPVWSIGTGKNASTEIAQNVCAYIRSILANLFGQDIASQIVILYGGSVKPVNIKEYLKQEDIDGALVGGASLEVNSFIALVKEI